MLILRNYQEAAKAAVYEHLRDRDDNPCVVLPTGCHAAGHPILMFDGTVRPVEDIRVGDKLMGPDSRPRQVKRLCRGEDEMFRVVPRRGEPFIVNGDHILSLMSTNEGKRWDCSQKGGEITNITVCDYLTKARSWKHLRKLYRVPIDFQSSAILPLPPYILGLLIGDGHIVDTVELTTADEETADAWDNYVQSTGSRTIVRDRDNRCPTYRMITGRGKYNIVTEVLENLGLAGCRSFNKFIPHIYLTANRNDRLQLLAGLIDSDGSRHRSGFEITTASRELAADIVFLCRSLGYSANCASKYSCCQTGADGWYFRIHIDGNCHEVPCRLPRKQAGRRAQKKDPLRTGFKIEACGRAQYFGFELSGDHLYVDGNFVV
ncbi:MAG: Hint domain-containing homing endonuclease, partial [Fuerstiella sp.]